jgi:hypothetical protein
MPSRAPISGKGSGGTLLDEIEYRFRLLAEGPDPLAVDGRQLGHGLPRRLIALPELSAILMHPSCGFAARDGVWRLLVGRARTGDAKWTVGAVGVALPGLRRAAYRLSCSYTGDVQATLVTEFVAALGSVNLERPRVVSRLLDAASSAAGPHCGPRSRPLPGRRISRRGRCCPRRRTGTRIWCSPAL